MNIIYKLIAAADTKIDPGRTGIIRIDANTVLANGLDIFYFAAGATAVIAIIIGSFYFVTSGNEPASLTKARNVIIYSSIGLAVISAAFIATKFILGAFK